MALAKIYSGTSAELSDKEVEEGSIYFTVDTKEIVADIPNGERTSFGKTEELQEVTRETVDEIFKKYHFEETEVDIDDIYTTILNRLLNDPNAVFKGATEESAGRAGLVPAFIAEEG